jgi:hypothetical protein
MLTGVTISLDVSGKAKFGSKFGELSLSHSKQRKGTRSHLFYFTLSSAVELSVLTFCIQEDDSSNLDTEFFHVRSEVFMAVTMKNIVFWDIKIQFVLQRRHKTLRYRAQPVNAM